MNKKNFYVGMGLGLAASGLAAMAMRPKKNKRMKKAMKAVSEVMDTVSGAMGW